MSLYSIIRQVRAQGSACDLVGYAVGRSRLAGGSIQQGFPADLRTHAGFAVRGRDGHYAPSLPPVYLMLLPPAVLLLLME